MKRKLIFVCSALFSLLMAAFLQAQVPQLLNYQGKLVMNGQTVNGPVNITFAIYDTIKGGTPLWSERRSERLTNGILDVILGSSSDNPLPKDLFTKPGNRFLAITVENNPQELEPRARIASVAYAIKAESANSLDAPDGSRTDAVVVDNNGKVGVGTTNPNSLVHLSSGAGTTDLRITNTVVPVEGVLLAGLNGGLNRMVLGTLTPHDLAFSAGNATWMTIKESSGNVGIGTTNPQTKLQLTSTANTAVRVSTTAAYGNASAAAFQLEQGGQVWQIATGANDFGGEGGLGFRLSAPNILDADATKMVITRAGNVGIGTPDPKVKLDVFGSIAFFGNSSIYRDLALNALVFNTPGISGNPQMVIRDNGNVGIGTTLPFERLVVEGKILHRGIMEMSSRELKENIADLSGQEAASALRDLNPVRFNYKTDEKKELRLGFIAEDVPEIVASADHKAVSTTNIITILTKVVQEQQKEIAALREEMKTLRQETEAKNASDNQ